MIELLYGAGFVGYAVGALVYSIRMENNRALKQVHKIKSEHDWAERCYHFGFFWPVAPLVNFIIRRKNDHR